MHNNKIAHHDYSILQRFNGGEILTAFLKKIAILKCFFFILLLRFFAGALAD